MTTIQLNTNQGTANWWRNFMDTLPGDNGFARACNRDTLLAEYAATVSFVPWPIVVFDSEEDATLFLLRWS